MHGSRLAVIVICYLLSAFGLLAPFVMLMFANEENGGAEFLVMVPIMTYAWLCHIVMSIGWLHQRRVKRFWPVTGTLAGIASIFWLPLVARVVLGEPIEAKYLLFYLVFPGFLVWPTMILGIYLVWFHLRPKS